MSRIWLGVLILVGGIAATFWYKLEIQGPQPESSGEKNEPPPQVIDDRAFYDA